MDKWQIALDEQVLILRDCQKSKELDSCMKCDKIINCIIRDKYIKSVYESMNKGAGGGFEF